MDLKEEEITYAWEIEERFIQQADFWKNLGECVMFLQVKVKELCLSAVLAQDPEPAHGIILRVMGKNETWYVLKFTILVYDCTWSFHLFNKFLFIFLI